ncbi:helix-turn-helix domain-containing protein [Reyranella sp.]|uniref:helix-turn-helix domain-containing protein n=1 Tax=Reyranella sp. TaxID=1929291 RepID=UPI003D0C0FD2
MKLERLDFLADNPRYTERFAMDVGRRCSRASVRDVARELGLDWHTVKDLEKQYMRAQLAAAGAPSPVVIGVDEISVRRGHTYRIVVSDLLARRPIWFGGTDRSEASLARFYADLGAGKMRPNPPRRDGHVEAVPQCRHGGGPAGGDPARRRIPPSRGPHLHARPSMMPRIHPLESAKSLFS